MYVSPIIKYRTLAIAKASAPVDSGNLRHNAIFLTKVKMNKWTIRHSTKQASYLIPLIEGWTNSKTGANYEGNDFIGSQSVPKIVSYLISEFDSTKKRNNTNGYLRAIGNSAQNNAKREMNNLTSHVRYSELRKLGIGNEREVSTYVYNL
jgi:hypothetical protein